MAVGKERARAKMGDKILAGLGQAVITGKTVEREQGEECKQQVMKCTLSRGRDWHT